MISCDVMVTETYRIASLTVESPKKLFHIINLIWPEIIRKMKEEGHCFSDDESPRNLIIQFWSR